MIASTIGRSGIVSGRSSAGSKPSPRSKSPPQIDLAEHSAQPDA
ncbi:MAG: hypothetical protein RLO52_10630 [Sandaracinaceae bacterium]